MNDNNTSVLTGILQVQTKDELQEIGEFFGVQLRASDRKAAMVHRLEMAFRTDTLRCLKCLPFYELRILQQLIAQGKGVRRLIPETLPHIFTYLFGLLENENASGDQGLVMRLYLKDEIFALFAPVIDTAVKEVEESGRAELEHFLWGCMTVYGLLSMGELVNLRREFYPEEDLRIIYTFLDTYAPLYYVADDYYEFLMYPDLHRLNLISAQEARRFYGHELAKVPLDDILAAGRTTPYNYPYAGRPEGRALAAALDTVGLRGDAGALRMHWIWWDKQNEGGDIRGFHDLVQRILDDARADGFESEQRLVGAITDYSNAIPTWVFRGRSSDEMMKEERTHLKPLPSGSGAPVAGSRSAAVGGPSSLPGLGLGFDSGFGSVPRVGRNDPCPCGSGLKYKNCHGKWES